MSIAIITIKQKFFFAHTSSATLNNVVHKWRMPQHPLLYVQPSLYMFTYAYTGASIITHTHWYLCLCSHSFAHNLLIHHCISTPELAYIHVHASARTHARTHAHIHTLTMTNACTHTYTPHKTHTDTHTYTFFSFSLSLLVTGCSITCMYIILFFCFSLELVRPALLFYCRF